MGSKNHEVVPTVLIVQISGLRNGGVNKLLGSLAKRNLVGRVQNSRCMSIVQMMWLGYTGCVLTFRRQCVDDGYRLTYGGYDYLAMRALSKRDSMYSVGNQIGVGKESGTWSCTTCIARVAHRGIRKTSTSLQTTKERKWSSNFIGACNARGCDYIRLTYPSLGRISFRAIKEKRDYLGKRKSASWMYMSRLAAQKEYTFMKVS